MRFPILLGTGLLATILGGCGGASMAGSSGGARKSEATGSSEDGTLKGAADDDQSHETPDTGTDKERDDLEALGQCLENFGDHPFGKDWQGSYRKIAASVQVLGIGNAIVDKVVTDMPKLILVSAAVNVLGAPKFELLNPNGWYCIKVGVNVLAKPEIKLHCDAHLTENKVNVGVLSSGEPTASIGVDVLSDVKVSRIGGCEG